MERVVALDQLLDDPNSKTSRKRLKDALSKKTALVVARAAEIVLELERRELVSDLKAAFFRLLAAGWKADRGCRAKEAIVKTLDGLDSREHDVFLAGARYAQLEPAWGEPVDTAVGLRGTCAVALVNSRYHEATNVLAVLLADPEYPVRISAAAALGASGQGSAIPLLRYKTIVGDEESAVCSEVLGALLHLEGDSGVDFVARLLGSSNEVVAETAALALGQSRLEAGQDALKQWAESSEPGAKIRKIAYLAIGISRTPSSREYLLGLIMAAEPEDAALAIEALAIYRHDRTLVKQIHKAVRQRNDPWLTQRVTALELAS